MEAVNFSEALLSRYHVTFLRITIYLNQNNLIIPNKLYSVTVTGNRSAVQVIPYIYWIGGSVLCQQNPTSRLYFKSIEYTL